MQTATVYLALNHRNEPVDVDLREDRLDVFRERGFPVVRAHLEYETKANGVNRLTLIDSDEEFPF